MKEIHFQETEYGFEYGDAKITRLSSDEKKGRVTLSVESSKCVGHDCIQIYITKTGKIRIFAKEGEWKPPEGYERTKRNKSK